MLQLKKKSDRFRVRRQSIPILAPPVPGGMTLEKSLTLMTSSEKYDNSQKISHPIPSCSVSCHIVLTSVEGRRQPNPVRVENQVGFQSPVSADQACDLSM